MQRARASARERRTADSAPQELSGARVLAELRHGDAAQKQRRRVVTQAMR